MWLALTVSYFFTRTNLVFDAACRSFRTTSRLRPADIYFENPQWSIGLHPCARKHRCMERCTSTWMSSASRWRPLPQIEHRLTQQEAPTRLMGTVIRRKRLPSAFPVLDVKLLPFHRHVYESNLRNSVACHQRWVYTLVHLKIWIFRREWILTKNCSRMGSRFHI